MKRQKNFILPFALCKIIDLFLNTLYFQNQVVEVGSDNSSFRVV